MTDIAAPKVDESKMISKRIAILGATGPTGALHLPMQFTLFLSPATER